MRCETNHRRGFLVFEQMRDEALKRDLSLCEWPLVEGRKNFTSFDQRHQLLKEIGRHYLNLSKHALFFESLEDWDTVCRAYVQALWFGVAVEQRESLSVSFLWALMRFDCREQAEMGSDHGKRGCKASKLFGVVERGEFSGDSCDVCFAIELVRKELRRQRTTGIGVCGDQADAVAARCIAGNAKHRRAMHGEAMNDWIKFSRITRREDDAVVFVLQSCFQQFEVSLAKSLVLIKSDFYMQPYSCLGGSPYSGSQGVEKVGDLFWKNDCNFDSSIELQCLRRKIGFVAQLLGHLQNARFGLRAYAGSFVQCPIYRADRDAQCLCDVFDAGSFRVAIHRVRRWSKRCKTYTTALSYRPRGIFRFGLRRAYRDFRSQSILQQQFLVGSGDVDRMVGGRGRYRAPKSKRSNFAKRSL